MWLIHSSLFNSFRTLKTLVQNLWLLSWRPLYKRDVLSTVGIHATILTLIIATFSAYGLFVYGRIDQFKEEIYNEACRANAVRAYAFILSNNPDGTNTVMRRKRLNRLRNIIVTDCDDQIALFNKYGKADSTENEEIIKQYLSSLTKLSRAELGKIVSHCMSSIAIQYPFSQQCKPGIIKQKSEIHFEKFTIDEMEAWLKEIEEVTSECMRLKSKYGDKIDAMLSAAARITQLMLFRLEIVSGDK